MAWLQTRLLPRLIVNKSDSKLGLIVSRSEYF